MQLSNNFSALLVCKIHVFDIFNITDCIKLLVERFGFQFLLNDRPFVVESIELQISKFIIKLPNFLLLFQRRLRPCMNFERCPWDNFEDYLL